MIVDNRSVAERMNSPTQNLKLGVRYRSSPRKVSHFTIVPFRSPSLANRDPRISSTLPKSKDLLQQRRVRHPLQGSASTISSHCIVCLPFRFASCSPWFLFASSVIPFQTTSCIPAIYDSAVLHSICSIFHGASIVLRAYVIACHIMVDPAPSVLRDGSLRLERGVILNF